MTQHFSSQKKQPSLSVMPLAPFLLRFPCFSIEMIAPLLHREWASLHADPQSEKTAWAHDLEEMRAWGQEQLTTAPHASFLREALLLVITDQKQAQDFVAWCIEKKEETKRDKEKKQGGQHG